MIESWSNFFYAPADPTSLAVFRIAFGILVVLDAASYARHANDLLGPTGFVPFEDWRAGSRGKHFSLLRWLPRSIGSVYAVLLLYSVAGLAVAIGFATRTAAIVTLIAGVSIYHRNRFVLHSGDALMRLLNFLLIFSSAGAVLSVDNQIGNAESPASATWPLRLMQIQVAVLYLHAVRFKLKGRMWRAGTATHYATNLLTHRRRRLPRALDSAAAHRFASYGTIAVEFAAGTLVWFDGTRYYALAAAAILHLSLEYFMRMHLFQWVMLSSLVLFVPGEDMAAFLSQIGLRV